MFWAFQTYLSYRDALWWTLIYKTEILTLYASSDWLSCMLFPQILSNSIHKFCSLHILHHIVKSFSNILESKFESNFMCQLDCSTGCPNTWLNIIRGVYGWISIWIIRPCEQDCLHQGGCASSKPVYVWIESKLRVKDKSHSLLVFEPGCWSVPDFGSSLECIVSPLLVLKRELCSQLSSIYSLQLQIVRLSLYNHVS